MFKYLLIWNDGSTEQRGSLSKDLIHLQEKGILKFLFDVEKGEQLIGNERVKVQTVIHS